MAEEEIGRRLSDEEKEEEYDDPENDLEQRLAILEPDANRAIERAEKNVKVQENITKATIEKLRKKRSRVLPIIMPVETEFEEREIKNRVTGKMEMEMVPVKVEKIKFLVRRLGDKDRLDMLKHSSEKVAEMSDEEREALDQDLFKFLSKVVVQPKAPPEEWAEVDQTTLNFLVQRIIMMAAETDDGKLVHFFTK